MSANESGITARFSRRQIQHHVYCRHR